MMKLAPVVFVLCSTLAGCSSGISIDQACSGSAAASCAKLDQCIKDGTTVRYGSLAVCEARLKSNCVAALSAADTGNTPSSTEACATAMPGASCADSQSGNVAACQTKAGKRDNGAACAFPAQCSSAVCALDKGGTCGTCAGPSNAGDDCSAKTCSAHFICVADSSECQPLGTSGATCDVDHPCGYSFQCVTPAMASAGTCQPANATLGATCDPKKQTAAGCETDQGFVCSGMMKTCAALTYASAGSPCGDVSGTFTACTDGSTCFGSVGLTPGTCKANALEGQACDTSLGPSCMAPGRCVTTAGGTTGTCTLPDATQCN